MTVDRDIHLARALLIDGNPMLRGSTVTQLRELGVGYIAQATRSRDARTLIEREPFDIIVCSRELDETDAAGQELLEGLRREAVLPPSCVFVLLTQQVTYTQVVEAGEAALDVLLVRPCTTALLGERLAEARQRKRVLAEIFRALQAGEPQQALLHAIRRFQERAPFWVYCGRIAGELLLKLEKPGEARKVFERIAEHQPLTWARIGVARSQLALGEVAAARKQLAAALTDDPDNADLHELMGRVLVEQSDFAGALASYGQAASLTPACPFRAQSAGALAFYQGRPEQALDWLQRANQTGAGSRLFDPSTLMLLAFLHHDRADRQALAAMREALERWGERQGRTPRQGRFVHAARALEAVLADSDEAAVRAAIAPLLAEVDDDGFDLEATNLVLAVSARLPASLRRPGELAALAERLGQRHCTSRAVAEVMVAAARDDAEAAHGVRRAQTAVTSLAEQAMERAMAGAADDAASQLLEQGERWRNTRLLETGVQLARRYGARTTEALSERATASLRRWGGGAVAQLAGIQRAGRSPGGLRLPGLGA